ncbi:RebB family R body protein [Sneathiella marina]|uniref:RebB family R body protein n=1 Tax=Sneathiella marina TaxID=2950108 RepID=A0ABY4WCT3_9PROT|nr:RebB family R body protein [Sneathiella marina]USG63064.1 RebB family R body protein [Sneathiella marina]
MTEKQKGPASIKSVNSQVTDAITQANTINLGLAPAQAIGTLYQTTAQSIGTSMQNSVSNQQHMYSLGLASLTQNLQSILSQTANLSSRRLESPAFYDQRTYGQYDFQQPVQSPNHMNKHMDN